MGNQEPQHSQSYDHNHMCFCILLPQGSLLLLTTESGSQGQGSSHLDPRLTAHPGQIQVPVLTSETAWVSPAWVTRSTSNQTHWRHWNQHLHILQIVGGKRHWSDWQVEGYQDPTGSSSPLFRVPAPIISKSKIRKRWRISIFVGGLIMSFLLKFGF